MKYKVAIAFLLLAAFVAAPILTAIPVRAQPNTYYVSTTGSDITGDGSSGNPWQHIQFAVNKAESDYRTWGYADTIMVAAGVYDEALGISEPLTIIGAGTSTIIRPSGANRFLSAYSLTDIHEWPLTAGIFGGIVLLPVILVENTAITSTGQFSTILRGLEVDGIDLNDMVHIDDPLGDYPGIPYIFAWHKTLNTFPVGIVYGESSGVVESVSVVNMNTTVPIDRSYGIWLDSPNYANNVLIQDCKITGYYENGIVATGAGLTFNIASNVVTGPGHWSQRVNGIVIADASPYTGGGTGAIVDNTVSNNIGAGSPIAYPWMSVGIMDYGPSIHSLGYPGLKIWGNVVHDNDIGIVPQVKDDIYDNEIYKCTWGIQLARGAVSNSIHCNDIGSNWYGIYMMGKLSPYYTGVNDLPLQYNVANNNNIYDNYFGVQNDYPNFVFDAEDNWWNSASGPYVAPGPGDHVSSYVDYSNYLTALSTCAPPASCHLKILGSWVNGELAVWNGVGLAPTLITSLYLPGTMVTVSLGGPYVANPPVVMFTSFYTGWIGTGSVPASGRADPLSFIICEDSSIEYGWAYSNTMTYVGPITRSLPTIDGIKTPGEWDPYLLGTTTNSGAPGGAIVTNVYGFADLNYLYTAFEVNIPASPGWATAKSLSVPPNFYFRANQTITWPENGYTDVEMTANPNSDPWVQQTDGTDWKPVYADPNAMSTAGIVVGSSPGLAGTGPTLVWPYSYIGLDASGYWGQNAPGPDNGFVELKIPLSILSYAGTSNVIAISGDYWDQGVGNSPATFFVPLPVPFTVANSPANHDTPNPQVGTTQYLYGATVTASVTTPADVSGGTRYTCTGYTGTGDLAAGGSSSSVSFTITQPTTITWNWKTQYLLTVNSLYDSPTGAGWHDAGSTVTASVTSPTGNAHSTGWTGTGSVPTSGTTPTVTFTITQPSSITWNWALGPVKAPSVGGEWKPITMQALNPVNALSLAPWIILALMAAASALFAYRRIFKKRF